MRQAAHPHIQRQLKMRVRCQVRNVGSGVIYKEEIMEATGIDEGSVEVDKKAKNGPTGTCAFKRKEKKMVPVSSCAQQLGS